MKLKINGEIKEIENSNEEFLLKELLEKLGYEPQLIVVELNGEIINPNICHTGYVWRRSTVS